MIILNEFFTQLASSFSTIEYDLISAFFALFIYSGTLLINQVIGTAMALYSTTIKFDKRKFIVSLIRGALVVFGFLTLILIVDLTPLLIERLGLVSIDDSLQDLLTCGEIILILIQAYKNNVKDILDKLNILFLGSSVQEVKREDE